MIVIPPVVNREDRLTTDEVRYVLAALRGLSRGDRAWLADTKPLTGALEGCMEWKPPASMRNVCDMELRIVYVIAGDNLIVLAAYYREENQVFRRAVRRYRELQNSSLVCS